MEYLGISYNLKHPPLLDPNFVPLGVWNEAYLSQAMKPISIALWRPDGHIAVRHSFIRGTADSEEADFRYVERFVKSLLWSVGGCKLYVCGCSDIAKRLAEVYSPDGERNFESVFFRRIYGHPFQVLDIPLEACPEPQDGPRPIIGGHLEGCRIGLDVSGSVCEVSAVADGNCIFSQEFPWSPQEQEDPSYHYEHILRALQSAAAHFEKLDAIGISSAGIFSGNAPMAASLFAKVPRDRWDEVKTLYTRAAAAVGDVPVAVVNDRDVTALSAAMSTGAGSLMSLSLGVNEAVGYADRVQNVLGWINELSLAPVDLNEEAALDEVTSDTGAGSKYFSQEAAIRLAALAGIDLGAERSADEKLMALQALVQQDDPRAQAVYQTIGQYLAYTLLHYSKLYEIRHLMLLGRVMHGKGGEIVLRSCISVLTDEFPALLEKTDIFLSDKNTYRVGQAVAAASLPTLH